MPDEQFHDGLIAAWWSQSEGGPEIDYYRRTIDRSGEPVLDGGCGSGRLLIPYLQAGIDVDGSDRSAGMIRVCRDRLEAGGLTTQLYTQANHELDLPRRYRTIMVVGTFGIGTTRREDALALERLRPTYCLAGPWPSTLSCRGRIPDCGGHGPARRDAHVHGDSRWSVQCPTVRSSSSVPDCVRSILSTRC